MIIEGTYETPSVNLDASIGLLEFSGRSLPEDTTTFYFPVLSWIEAYIISPKQQTRIVVKLEYFNTASSKVLLNILCKFAEVANVTVQWFHYEDDEDMLESGREFEELVDLPFTFHQLD